MEKNTRKKNIPNNVEYQMFNDACFKDCFICFTGKEVCAPLHSFGPSVRPTYLIHYILRGRGIFIYDRQEYALEKGQAFLIEPDIMTYYQADKDDPWVYVWFGLRGDNVKTLMQRMGKDKHHPIMHFEDTAVVENIFNKMISTHTGGIEQEFIRQALMYEFLSLLSSPSSAPVRVTQSDELIRSDYVGKALEFIQNNFFHKIKVSDVAAHIGISRNYLFTLFKDAMGHSPREYIRYFRLSRACNMLDDSFLSIENVALYCGFEDANTFSKTFKKQFGITPRRYRQLKSERPDLALIDFLRYVKNLKQNKAST